MKVLLFIVKLNDFLFTRSVGELQEDNGNGLSIGDPKDLFIIQYQFDNT